MATGDASEPPNEMTVKFLEDLKSRRGALSNPEKRAADGCGAEKFPEQIKGKDVCFVCKQKGHGLEECPLGPDGIQDWVKECLDRGANKDGNASNTALRRLFGRISIKRALEISERFVAEGNNNYGHQLAELVRKHQERLREKDR